MDGKAQRWGAGSRWREGQSLRYEGSWDGVSHAGHLEATAPHWVGG